MPLSEFAARRERRRVLARQLRAEGLSVRAIGARLGVSHPTVLADLAERDPDPEHRPDSEDRDARTRRPALTTDADAARWRF